MFSYFTEDRSAALHRPGLALELGLLWSPAEEEAQRGGCVGPVGSWGDSQRPR